MAWTVMHIQACRSADVVKNIFVLILTTPFVVLGIRERQIRLADPPQLKHNRTEN